MTILRLGVLAQKFTSRFHNHALSMSHLYREIHTRRFMEKAVGDNAILFWDYNEYLDFAAARLAEYAGANGIASDRVACLEFGVAGGASINRLSQNLRDYRFVEFDSFDGFLRDPEKSSVWAPFQKRFKNQKPPQVNANVELIEGYVETTFPQFAKKALERADVFFIHFDMDVYGPTKIVLDWLVASGKKSFVLFDELINFEEFHLHEYRAFLDTVIEKCVPYRIHALCDRGVQNYGQFGKVFLEIR